MTTGPSTGATTVTLTGTNLGNISASNVKFGGASGTPVTYVLSTTDTTLVAVNPAHSTGLVDVYVDNGVAPAAILTNGFQYLTPAAGQLSSGGKIASVGGGFNNLILAPSPPIYIPFGGNGIPVPTSNNDGASNTASIVNAYTSAMISQNTYPAGICAAYSIDSAGNSCPSGTGSGTCYNDWFLPAPLQAQAMYPNFATIGLGSDNYMTCFESDANTIQFLNTIGVLNSASKNTPYTSFCVRQFTP